MIKIEKIKQVAADITRFPETARPMIEYNGELPEDENIKPDSFYGVKAKFNSQVALNHCVLTYKY